MRSVNTVFTGVCRGCGAFTNGLIGESRGGGVEAGILRVGWGGRGDARAIRFLRGGMRAEWLRGTVYVAASVAPYDGADRYPPSEGFQLVL